MFLCVIRYDLNSCLAEMNSLGKEDFSVQIRKKFHRGCWNERYTFDSRKIYQRTHHSDLGRKLEDKMKFITGDMTSELNSAIGKLKRESM